MESLLPAGGGLSMIVAIFAAAAFALPAILIAVLPSAVFSFFTVSA